MTNKLSDETARELLAALKRTLKVYDDLYPSTKQKSINLQYFYDLFEKAKAELEGGE